MLTLTERFGVRIQESQESLWTTTVVKGYLAGSGEVVLTQIDEYLATLVVLNYVPSLVHDASTYTEQRRGYPNSSAPVWVLDDSRRDGMVKLTVYVWNFSEIESPLVDDPTTSTSSQVDAPQNFAGKRDSDSDPTLSASKQN
jgi:hypothetical protein